MVAKNQKGAAYGCPNCFSPPKSLRQALRAAKEKAAQLGDDFSESLFLVGFYNQARTHFERNC